MINLPEVTLLQLNCVDPVIGVKAMHYSSKDINFGKKILLSHEIPNNLTDDITFYQIPKLDHSNISRFRFEELYKYIQTEYYLSIQTDGFVINPHLWTDEFLQYDYIGAPWPSLPWNSVNRVGNGGFRLESKRLLNLCTNIVWNGQHDDVMITNTFKDYFEEHGCKFPSIEVAATFSLEHKIPEVVYDLNNCFGFHGKLTQESRQYAEMIKTYEF
jgi:hypothetical protein